MEKENGSESNVEPVTQADLVEDTSKGLSLRDALEVAIEGNSDDAGSPSGAGKGDSRGAAGAEPTADGRGNLPGTPESAEEPPLQPPAEYTADEKADFLSLSRKGQEAQLRLHKSRMARIEDIKAAARDLEEKKNQYSHLQTLAADVEPFLRALGVKEKSSVAIQKALALWKQFEFADDPNAAAAAYLKAKGKAVPRELMESPGKDPFQEKIAPLQDKLIAVENRLAQGEREKAATVLSQVWSSFEQATNAAGSPRFPDIHPDKGEAGLKLASQVGSLVGGQTPLSQQFIASVRERNPNATIETFLTEAYRYLGGRIDDSQAAKSQSPQQHLIKSNRAASSVPGRGASSSSTGVRKFRNQREALEAAYAELNRE